jgi:hypothetical protein
MFSTPPENTIIMFLRPTQRSMRFSKQKIRNEPNLVGILKTGFNRVGRKQVKGVLNFENAFFTHLLTAPVIAE